MPRCKYEFPAKQMRVVKDRVFVCYGCRGTGVSYACELIVWPAFLSNINSVCFEAPPDSFDPAPCLAGESVVTVATTAARIGR